jgi:hypothetical protein
MGLATLAAPFLGICLSRLPKIACAVLSPSSMPCGSPAYVSIRQHTSAYVSIRQHTSVYLRVVHLRVSIREHTWAYVSIREHTWAYVSIPAGRASARQHTWAYVSIREHTWVYLRVVHLRLPHARQIGLRFRSCQQHVLRLLQCRHLFFFFERCF